MPERPLPTAGAPQDFDMSAHAPFSETPANMRACHLSDMKYGHIARALCPMGATGTDDISP